MTSPRIARHDSCVACFASSTTTAVSIAGEPDFIIATMSHLTGLSISASRATFDALAEQDHGREPGMVPPSVITVGVRLCSDCAAKTDARIVDALAVMAGEPVYTYTADLNPPIDERS
jgi:hypothetical protein